MTEREMEDLLWEHPEKFLNQPLKQFQRQPTSSVGRADLIFRDRIGRLLVIELKRDTLSRDAVPQLVDYYGMLKSRFPDDPVELMIIANRIPQERRQACERYDIDAVEISEKRFRDVAEEVGYVFVSEISNTKAVPSTETLAGTSIPLLGYRSRDEFPYSPKKIEKGWYYWKGQNGREYFLAFVNAKGNCSMRRFEASAGTFTGLEYKDGDYQQAFSDYLKYAVALVISRQPNLDKACKVRLPSFVLSELRAQIYPASNPEHPVER